MPTTTISARVDAEEARWIESLAAMEGCDRSTFIKGLVRRGVKAMRLDKAVAAYAAEEVTLSRAAEIAGMTVWDFVALMPIERLEVHYGVDEFEEDLALVRGATS